eukprot:SRR837773.624.p2 GENE.SRR837773.624~~SRR837773.624.p2  ORF type:complete len:369 (+),score=175.44 SRR837773.624:148-1107(+)
MCHSDLHTINGDWGNNKYPIAPGHEIAGVVRAVGDKVTNYKVGDNVAVGCMVLSCHECDLCKAGFEQHCPKMVQTYGSSFPEGRDHDDAAGNHTNGGYSTDITVHQRFVFRVPEGMPLETAGPLCCAGITTYAPLARHVKGKENASVGVVGFGGLGMCAVKIAKAMGAKVTVFGRNDAKKDAAAALGADLVVLTDEAAIGALARSFDCILDTVAVHHDFNNLMPTLKPMTGSYVLIGGIPQPYSVAGFPMIFNGNKLEGSLIGGVPGTQEMLDFCHKHNISPDTEVIHAKDAEACLKKLHENTAGARRFVIRNETLKEL